MDGWINPGLSLIAYPDGKIAAGPLEQKEGILYADVNQDQLAGPKWQEDTAGHYGRHDLFDQRVRKGRRPMISTYTDEEGAEIAESI